MQNEDTRNRTVEVSTGYLTAIFSHDYPNNHHFEILTGSKTIVDDKGQRWAIYSTRALVYLDSGCSKRHLVAESEMICYTPVKAMENFLSGATVSKPKLTI